jgi:hypothetical protein
MVAFTHLAVAVSAITGAFAAPAADPNADAPDFELSGPSNLARRQDYNQNYKTSGNVNFQPTNNGYSVSFSGAGDFVVGKGWRTGSARYDYLHALDPLIETLSETLHSLERPKPPPALSWSPSTVGLPIL